MGTKQMAWDLFKEMVCDCLKTNSRMVNMRYEHNLTSVSPNFRKNCTVACVLFHLFMLSLSCPVCTKDSQRNGCRERCSDVKWSVSAWLKPATSSVTKKCRALSEMICDGRKVPSWSEYRFKERSRSLEFFQTSWITLCWKVIMGC